MTLFVYLLLRLRICAVISHARSSWLVGEQPAENICTQGRGNDRRLRNPKFVVCRICYGNDQMKEDDMDDTYSMHGKDG
jgi:hypothetical protein